MARPVMLPMRSFGTIVDVRERRSLEERLRQTHKLEAIGNLASGIAHDFNNILLGITGYTELDGAIEVSSRLGEGTRFDVYVPARPPRLVAGAGRCRTSAVLAA